MTRRPPDERDQFIEQIIHLYAQGFFPMGRPGSTEIGLYRSDPRGVMPLTRQEGLHVPRRLERIIRSRRFTLTSDRAFETVVRGCADRGDDSEGDWITEPMIQLYLALFDAGHAHSIEAWRTDPESGEVVLVGGIYGVSIGAVFIGESMVHRARPRMPDGSRHPLDGSNASSVCLITLSRHLHHCGYQLFDTQMVTDHVARFGAFTLGDQAFMERLTPGVAMPDAWRPLEEDGSDRD